MSGLDFVFHAEKGGSLYRLWPLTDQARTWVAKNLVEPVTWHGSAVVIETRYMQDILHGIAEDGLRVEQALVAVTNTSGGGSGK